MKTILVLGGAGFIGSNLCEYLIDKSYNVIVVDNLTTGKKEHLHPNVTFMQCDFVSNDVLNLLMTSNDIEAIVHLAANPSVPYSINNPSETHRNNITKSIKLIDFVKSNLSNKIKFIFASSCAIYGDAILLPTDETSNFNPQSPYALQKMTIDLYLKLYAKFYGVNCCSLRFFNVFGKNSYNCTSYATAISSWLTAITQNKPIRFDGDGSQTRDMCHVDNVCHAIHLAIESKNNLNGESYNVACGEQISNKEILDYLVKLYPHTQINYADWRPGDVMHTLADISKIKRDLGYSVQTRFYEGLDKTITWFMNNYSNLGDS